MRVFSVNSFTLDLLSRFKGKKKLSKMLIAKYERLKIKCYETWQSAHGTLRVGRRMIRPLRYVTIDLRHQGYKRTHRDNADIHGRGHDTRLPYGMDTTPATGPCFQLG